MFVNSSVLVWKIWIGVLYLYVTRWGNSRVVAGFCLYQSLLIFLFVMLVILCILLSDLLSPNEIYTALTQCHRAKCCRIKVPVILILVSPYVLGPAPVVPLIASAGISPATVPSTSTITSPTMFVISATAIISDPYSTSIISVGL